MTYVIDNDDGSKIPCMWSDCQLPGHEEIKALVTVPGTLRAVHYVFCTLRHKMYWVNSHHDLGNLPTGSKGTIL